MAIFADVSALVMIRVQGPIDIPVRIGGWRGKILVLGLMHDLQIHPILVLTLIIDLQAAADITGFRIMPAPGLASLIVLYRKFQGMRVLMTGEMDTACEQQYCDYKYQDFSFHGVTRGYPATARLTRLQHVDHHLPGLPRI